MKISSPCLDEEHSPVDALGGADHLLGAVVDGQEFARPSTNAPADRLLAFRLARLDRTADQRGDDVRALEVEVVVRNVEVHRQKAGAAHT